MIRKYLIGLLLTFINLAAYTQDSTKVLTIHNFFSLVLKNNPVARQADLLDEKAAQELRIARGFLDPSINSKFYKKEFNSTDYYNLWDSYLRIPTWYGVDFKAGFERNTGQFVSDEHITPVQGLTYLGLSVPIGQGLLIDERRAQIKQAKQLAIMAEAEKVKVINKLLLQAAKDYWDWMFYHHKWNLYKEGMRLASVRFEAVRERVRYGDLSAIDTAEAMMQVQNFQILFTQAEVEYRNSSLILSSYLWNDEGIPVEINSDVIPSESGSQVSPLSNESLNNLVERAKTNHPDLIKLNAKLIQLNIEKRFVADKFKPKLYLDYNILQTGFLGSGDAFNQQFFGSNYKFGASFSYPLFLRNERGKYQLTKVKIQEINYELINTNRSIENSIQATANELEALEKQLTFQRNMVVNAEALQRGEQTRFENGESSIFLVNSRENSLISNQVKLFELKAKYAKNKAALQWAAGEMISY